MLARRHKIDPDTLFARAHRTVRGDHLMVAFAPKAKARGACAVIISGKTTRTAVLRHRIKRALFDTVGALPSLAFDIVVSVRRVPKDEVTGLLRQELVQLLNRLA